MNIPNSVTYIGSNAFGGCSSLSSVTIPNSITSIIGNFAFEYCSSLTSMDIPNSVTSVGYSAFFECTGLTSASIPNSVTSIGDAAFTECDSLTDVYSYITDLTELSIEGFIFDHCNNVYSQRTLHVPHGTASKYRLDFNWYPFFGTIVEMEPEVVLPGDVNGDGMIGIGDAAGIIDLILAGNATIEDNPAADANGDGIINIVDVTHLIDIILYPNN